MIQLQINARNVQQTIQDIGFFKDDIFVRCSTLSRTIAGDIRNDTDAAYGVAAGIIGFTEEATNARWTSCEFVSYNVAIVPNMTNCQVVGTGGASWLEFGTGVKKNATHPHPYLMQSGIGPYGSYGKHNGATGHHWKFAPGHLSYGYAASCGMYNATETARQNLQNYIGRVF